MLSYRPESMHASGSEKRKRKQRVDDLIQSQGGAMDNFFKSNTSSSINPNDELAIVAVEEEEPTNGNSVSGQRRKC